MGHSLAATPSAGDSAPMHGSRSGPELSFRQGAQVGAQLSKARTNLMLRETSVSAFSSERGHRGRGPLQAYGAQAGVGTNAADKKLAQAIEHFEAGEFFNALSECRRAICVSAPTAASTARPPVLQQCVCYKLAITAYQTVQAINAQQKREAINPQQLKRQVCLCIFLCELDVAPRHRVRFMRRTILLMMRNQNWGLAAMYLEFMRAHTHKGRDKLDAELRQCHANELRNQEGMVPEADLLRADNVGRMTLQEA